MSEIETPVPKKTNAPKPGSNIYSVLVFIAFGALVMGIIVMWMKNVDLTGTGNPFTIVR